MHGRSFWPNFFSRIVARLQWNPMAIDLAPDKADYYAYRSEIYGDYDHGRQMADANKAIQIDANSGEAHAALAAFEQAGDHRYAASTGQNLGGAYAARAAFRPSRPPPGSPAVIARNARI